MKDAMSTSKMHRLNDPLDDHDVLSDRQLPVGDIEEHRHRNV